MTRPNLLTDEVVRIFVECLGNGVHRDIACKLAKISVQTYYCWRRKGKADIEAGVDSDMAQWVQACDHAEANAEAVVLYSLRGKALDGDVKACQFILERRGQRRWAIRRDWVTGGSDDDDDVNATTAPALATKSIAELKAMLEDPDE
jgi:hypothetical protein